MAQLAGVGIADRDSALDSGIALLLTQKSSIDDVVQPDSKWEVEVRSDNPYVIARGTGPTDSSTAFALAYEAVQKGLDLLSVTGKANLSIRNASEESLVWWREDQAQVLRVVGSAGLTVNVSVMLEVRDEFGNVKPQPPAQPPKYHESLRYFRLSQVTEDLFDAYRNMWLSFELLLSSEFPKNGREITWLRRALSQTHESLDLHQVFQPTGSDAVAEIVDELYIGTRLPLFHATEQRTVFMPHSLRDRQTVSVALRKLTKLVLFLIDKWLNAKRVSGVMTSYAFDTTIGSIISSSEILVSDDNTPADPAHGTRANAGFESAIALATKHAPELSESGRQFALGTVDSTDLQMLEKITKFALADGDDLISYHTLEAELIHESIDRLEAQMGFHLINAREPKYLFKV